MISTAVVIALASTSLITLQEKSPAAVAPDPANWTCAQPMIDRTFSRGIDSRELSQMIAERCARPYAAVEAAPGGGDLSEERQLYQHRLSSFRHDIEYRIERSRRQEVVLRRR